MKLLYDTTTSAILPWPRTDNDPVVGLAEHLLEMDVVQEPQPAFDPATQRLEETEIIDAAARTVTCGWSIVAIEPPEPITAGESWVAAQGYGASRMITLLDELLTADRNATTAQRPKLVAVYQWSQTVKGMALAGAVEFPNAPWSFEEVLTEGAAE